MRRLLLTIVALLAFAASATGQVAQTEKPEQVIISFALPEGWYINAQEPEIVLFSTTEVDWLGEEFPPSHHPWLAILASTGGLCDNLLSERPIFGFAKGRALARICRKGVVMLLGYSDQDKEKDRHVREMLEIAESVRHVTR